LDTENDKQIGIIGLGLVGQALAKRLIQAGYHVFGYDILEDARTNAENIGVEIFHDARQIAYRTKILLLSLLTSNNRRDLCWGRQSLAETLQP
jgi:3-hydroxyisobutyrate dehydrogenase